MGVRGGISVTLDFWVVVRLAVGLDVIRWMGWRAPNLHNNIFCFEALVDGSERRLNLGLCTGLSTLNHVASVPPVPQNTCSSRPTDHRSCRPGVVCLGQPVRACNIDMALCMLHLGDVVVASGTLSYLGPFTAEYRTRIADGWVQVTFDARRYTRQHRRSASHSRHFGALPPLFLAISEKSTDIQPSDDNRAGLRPPA